MSRIAAFNNNYHLFSQVNADYCEITIDGLEFPNYKDVLYPDKNGVFRYNTYEFSKYIFDFYDNYDYSGSVVDNNQFKSITFDIKVYLNNGNSQDRTLDATFYNGVFQRWECPFVEDDYVNLSELKIPHFVGYPLEYSVIAANGEIIRDLISNGGDGNTNKGVAREIQTECEGYYLKFHNSSFGYSYFLFENIAREVFNPKSVGKLREQFSWTDNYFELGKKGSREVEVFSNVLYEDRELMKALAKSNEVYLYTGNQGDVADKSKWLQVRIEMSVDETNKNSSFDQVVKVILPQEKTRTRI